MVREHIESTHSTPVILIIRTPGHDMHGHDLPPTGKNRLRPSHLEYGGTGCTPLREHRQARGGLEEGENKGQKKASSS